MPLIPSQSFPADGDTAVVEPYNLILQVIIALLNGGLDSANIASLNGALILAGSIPSSAFAPSALTGWTPLAVAPNTITDNGNHSYTMVFNSVDETPTLSPGMRLRTTRTAPAPNQCATFNGSTQFYSKSTPNKLTFTDDFVVSAWIKIPSYINESIVSRFNGTSGWDFQLTVTGQVALIGYNAGGSNLSYILSTASVPLNKWVHIVAQLDMSGFTNTPTTSYIMIDGVDVFTSCLRGGSNPTALVQAGNLEIGSRNGGTLPFMGEIAQVAIYNAKVSEATVSLTRNQGLVGTETSLASAYSFNNTITDLNTTTPNDLTANGSIVATTADSPFGGQGNGSISTTLDYAIVQSIVFSTNTTMIVQVPEGCTIPTTSGISALAYSGLRVPYGMPAQKTKWTIQGVFFTDTGNVNVNSISVAQLIPGFSITAPVGEWDFSEQSLVLVGTASAGTICFNVFCNTTSTRGGLFNQRINVAGSVTEVDMQVYRTSHISAKSPTTYSNYLLLEAGSGVVNYRQPNAAITDTSTINLLNSYL